MLQRDELKLIQDDEQYLELMLEGPEAMAHITPGSLLFLVDHHRPMLCASKEVMEAIPKRIIIDHHRRAEDAIKETVLQYMEPSSSSTSELVTELVGYFNDRLEFTKGEATALYAASLSIRKILPYRPVSAPLKRQLYCAAAGLTRLW